MESISAIPIFREIPHIVDLLFSLIHRFSKSLKTSLFSVENPVEYNK